MPVAPKSVPEKPEAVAPKAPEPKVKEVVKEVVKVVEKVVEKVVHVHNPADLTVEEQAARREGKL